MVRCPYISHYLLIVARSRASSSALEYGVLAQGMELAIVLMNDGDTEDGLSVENFRNRPRESARRRQGAQDQTPPLYK